MDLDLDQLARRILRPDRPRLAEARDAVAGFTDPREAWEQLGARGLVRAPGDGATARKFCGPQGGQQILDAPPSVALALALAADPEGVARAEAAALAAARGMAAWGVPGEPVVAWSLAWPDPFYDDTWGPSAAMLAATQRARLPAASSADGRANRAAATGEARVQRWLSAADRWQKLVAVDARVPPLRGLYRAVPRGVRFAELPDSLSHLAAIVSLGYAPYEVRRALIVLVTSEVRGDG